MAEPFIPMLRTLANRLVAMDSLGKEADGMREVIRDQIRSRCEETGVPLHTVTSYIEDRRAEAAGRVR